MEGHQHCLGRLLAVALELQRIPRREGSEMRWIWEALLLRGMDFGQSCLHFVLFELVFVDGC